MTLSCAPTLDDLLADPLVQALMSADHVDAASLRRDMTETAAQIARPRGLGFSGARVRFGNEPQRSRAVPPRSGSESWLCC